MISVRPGSDAYAVLAAISETSEGGEIAQRARISSASVPGLIARLREYGLVTGHGEYRLADPRKCRRVGPSAYIGPVVMETDVERLTPRDMRWQIVARLLDGDRGRLDLASDMGVLDNAGNFARALRYLEDEELITSTPAPTEKGQRVLERT